MGWFFNKPEIRSDEVINDASLQAALRPNVVTANNVMQIPTFAACVNFLADTISMLPIKLYKKENDDNGRRIIKEIEDERVKLLNVDPNDTLNSTELKAAIVRDYLVHGSAYVFINKTRNEVKSLNYVKKEDISIWNNTDPIFKNYSILIGGRTYYPYQFLKILRNSKDGSTGIGVFEENSKILEVAYNTLVFENNLVAKGGNKRGFLQASKRLTQEAIDALKNAWRRLYSNDNEENVVILNDGITFKESSATSTEMQINENKLTNKKEICSIFKICPSVISEKATDEEYNLTIKMAVLPILNEIVNTLNRDLLLEKEKQDYFFAFDTAEVMRGDIQKRYTAYNSAIKAGWITKNEVRAKENLVAIEGLDIISMSLGDVIFNTETGEYFTPNTGSIKPTNGENIILEKGGENNADESRET